MIIPTPALIGRVSSAKQLFWTTLKSNFKTRLRYTLKHLGSMHDPESHGNWSRGPGMYGGKVGLAGKVRHPETKEVVAFVYQPLNSCLRSCES